MVAADAGRTGAADAVPGGGFLQRGDHVQVLAQAQVIVAAETDQLAAIDQHLGAVAGLDLAARAQRGLGHAIGARGGQAVAEADAGHVRRRRPARRFRRCRRAPCSTPASPASAAGPGARTAPGRPRRPGCRW